MKLYNNAIREIYESNLGKNMKAIGIIYNLIPYVNKELNTLCYNVNCNHEDKLKLVTAGDLAKALGYSGKITQMQKMLCKIELSNGEPILLFISNGDKVNDKIVINPMLMYSGGDIPKIHEIFKSYAINNSNLKRLK